MNTSIKSLLSKTPKTTKIRCIQPADITHESILIPKLSFEGPVSYRKAEEFHKHPTLQPFQISGYIPKDKSEIKGVDSMVHRWATNKFSINKYPPILKNQFMIIQYFPKDHIISQFRKSNISFILNLFRIPEFNNFKLAKSINEYKGKYSFYNL